MRVDEGQTEAVNLDFELGVLGESQLGLFVDPDLLLESILV